MQFLSPIVDWLAKQKISIVLALTVSVTALVIFAVAAILAFGGLGENGSDLRLVEKRAKAGTELAATRAQTFLQPLESLLDHMERRVRAGDVNFSDIESVKASLQASMGPSPQIHIAGYSLYRGNTVLVQRTEGDAFETQLEPGIFGAPIWNKDADFSGKVLAPVLYQESTQQTLIPLIRRIQIDDETRIQIVVAATASAFSEWMTASSDILDSGAFTLYGPDRVLAHPQTNGLTRNADEADRSPLPHVSETKDPVLLALWRDKTKPVSFATGEAAEPQNTKGRFRYRLATVSGGAVLVPLVELNGLTEQTWLIGIKVPFDASALRQASNSQATWVTLIVGALLIALTFALARLITQPLDGLAETARQVSRLQLDNIPRLRPSIFREFNDAADAFKTMTVGLNWFQSYVPSALVRKLLKQADDGELQPETKTVTIMFTDVVGFTQLSERMEAHDIVDMLNEHFSLVGQCIDQEAGTIDKYIGDSLMAFWGAPDQQPDHAIRAVDAAEAIATALADKNEMRRDLGEDPITMRIGIFTGQVSVGNIGAPGRINYTVIGDAVNAAQRLEKLGGTLMEDDEEAVILISAETIASIERNASDLNKKVPKERFRHIGNHALEGRSEPTGVYRLA